MATFLQTINRTLIALGHADDLVADAATSLTDNYHIKIAQFVNDILEQVEDAAQWRVRRTRDTATISASALSASLSSSNERSRIWHVHDPAHEVLVPLVFDVTASAAQTRLRPLDLAELLRRDQENSNADGGSSPSHFSLSPTASGMDVFVWPRPSTSVNVEADMIIPQSRLPHTSNAELITSISVPTLVVVLGATWWAMEDRGEELGPRGILAKDRYDRELAQVVSLEHSAQGLDVLVPV